ncbi:uncharacterized protein I206_107746 [Kwoniella pini CBS 10737]|uniref:Uncharacterized protein n=1 Tax=Kwoniella pini CBS 10737 TaxID=1296096 RepID=A0A1B9HY62_9TREE|nr:uncharacterized protein I206_06080 [Kwoniella pini CBS 10737]OCF48212.1 hypothetical protein I206_06080 [Kwoniella pini CBS 10737]
MATVRTYQSSPRSIRGIIVVILILLGAYIFFNGKKKKKASTKSDRKRDRRDDKSRGRGNRNRDERERGSSGSEDDKRERRKNNRSKRGDDDNETDDQKKKKNKKKNKSDSDEDVPYQKILRDKKIPWDQPPSGEPPISVPPDHRVATPSKSAFRQRSPDDVLPPSPNTQQGNKVRWTDNEKGLSSPVTNHRRNWEDYMGTTDETDQGVFQNKLPKDKSNTVGKGVPHPSRWSFENISGKLDGVHGNILELMKQIELISKVKESDDPKLWYTALQDSWDEHLGSIPKIVTLICNQLSRCINEQEMNLVVKKMKERQAKKAAPDKKRDVRKWTRGLDESGVHPSKIGEEAYRYKFLLGWYLDTFRSKNYEQRMAIDNTGVNMTSDPKISKISYISGWLEYIAELNKYQRLFIGWDLSGLTIRAQAIKDKETNNLRLDLTIFLPCQLEDSIKWTKRFSESCDSFRHFHTELIKALDGTSNDVIQNESFSRRRIIFRPGWLIKNVNSNNLNSKTNLNEIDKNISNLTILKRNPKIIEINSKEQIENSNRLKELLGKLDNKSNKKAISRVRPEEIVFHEIRQYQWDKLTLTNENNSLSSESFWIGYMLLGDRLQNKIELGDHHLPRSTYDFIRSIDLGSYIPFHQTNPKTFLKIDKYPALELLVIAYVPLGRPGSTVELILQEEYGLTHELSITREPTQHLVKQSIRLKLFVAIPDVNLVEHLQNDFDNFFAQKGNAMMAQGMSKNRVRQGIMGIVVKVLDNVYVVDESIAATPVEGKLPKGIKLNYQPTFPPGLQGDDETSTTPTSSFSQGDRPSPFLSSSPVQRPPGPGPQSPQGPFSPPGPRSLSPHSSGQNRPPPQFTDPQRSEQALKDAQNRAAMNAQMSPPSSPPSQSNYRPPSVQDANEEDAPMTEGRFGNLRNADGGMSKGGSGEKGPQVDIP